MLSLRGGGQAAQKINSRRFAEWTSGGVRKEGTLEKFRLIERIQKDRHRRVAKVEALHNNYYNTRKFPDEQKCQAELHSTFAAERDHISTPKTTTHALRRQHTVRKEKERRNQRVLLSPNTHTHTHVSASDFVFTMFLATSPPKTFFFRLPTTRKAKRKPSTQTNPKEKEDKHYKTKTKTRTPTDHENPHTVLFRSLRRGGFLKCSLRCCVGKRRRRALKVLPNTFPHSILYFRGPLAISLSVSKKQKTFCDARFGCFSPLPHISKAAEKKDRGWHQPPVGGIVSRLSSHTQQQPPPTHNLPPVSLPARDLFKKQ